MTIQAVVFDIGGVLEITPRLGVSENWESRLGLAPGELDERMSDAWLGSSIRTITERDVADALTERLGLDERQRGEFLADLWREYLGTANTELIDYARRLRPRYRTGILSTWTTPRSSRTSRRCSPASPRRSRRGPRAVSAAAAREELS